MQNNISQNTLEYFQGTANDFIKAGIMLNEHVLDQVSISVLVRCGILKIVGEGQKPLRGKTPKIFRVEKNTNIKIIKVL